MTLGATQSGFQVALYVQAAPERVAASAGLLRTFHYFGAIGASVVTGICFLLATFLAPLVAIIPSEAAAPALVVVGFLMVTQVLDIDWTDWEIAMPAFFAMVLMPFTYSITVGIGAGVILFVVLQAVTGKARKLHPLMWVIAVLFVVYFMRGPIQTLIG